MRDTSHPADKRIQNDLRAIRQAAGLTLDTIAEIIGVNKDALSKMERGVIRIKLFDYLRIVRFCRDAIPDHPAVQLAEFYLAPPRKIAAPRVIQMDAE